MHIAFVIPDLKGGGAQKMMINLANELATRGDRVDLILFNQSGIYKDLISPQVNIVDFNKPRSLSALLSLVFYIKKSHPDIMMSALFHVNLITLLAKIFSLSKKTKIIISERNNLTLRLSEMTILKRLSLKILIKILYPFANKIVGISEGVCNDLKNIIASDTSKIMTIHNPVVTPDFEEKIQQKVENIFPDNCGLKLITSGRLVMQKDYPTLLRALSHYNKKYGAAHLVIMGEGALKEDMVRMSKRLNINNNIMFLGFVDNPLAYMKQADIFVISSAWEGFCNVIVEALYAGLKVVSTNCPSGPAEILQDGKYGGLVEVGDCNAFAQKINDIDQKEISKETQKKRALDFTVEKKADEFKNLFKDVLNA